jgi:hypothetical protein
VLNSNVTDFVKAWWVYTPFNLFVMQNPLRCTVLDKKIPGMKLKKDMVTTSQKMNKGEIFARFRHI